jgi:hypothetical protein
LLVVKIIGRFLRCRSFTTWKSTLAASDLASLVAGFPNPAKDLQTRQVGFLFQNPDNDLPEILNDTRSGNLALLSLRSVIDMNDWGFYRNAVDRT